MTGRRIALFLFLCFFLFVLPAAADSVGTVTFGRSEITIVTAGGARFPFTVEVAETPEQLRQGLMYRETMAPDAGMLFRLGTEEVASFWMHNTFLPLDMIFIARDGHVTNIHRNAAPGSTAIISSVSPVVAVLEVNAGTSARLGLHAGDRVTSTALP